MKKVDIRQEKYPPKGGQHLPNNLHKMAEEQKKGKSADLLTNRGAKVTTPQNGGGVFLPGITGNSGVQEQKKDVKLPGITDRRTEAVDQGNIKSNVVLPGITKPATTIKSPEEGLVDYERRLDEQYEGQTIPLIKGALKEGWNNVKKFGNMVINNAITSGMDQASDRYLADNELFGKDVSKEVEEYKKDIAKSKKWKNEYIKIKNEEMDKWRKENLNQYAREDFASKNVLEMIRKRDWRGLKYGVTEMGAQSLGMMLPTIIVGAVTRDPTVMGGVGFMSAYPHLYQEVYEEGMAYGLTSEQAELGATLVGSIGSILEVFGFEKVFGKFFTASKGGYKPLLKIFADTLKDLGEGAGAEALTEASQEFLKNLYIHLYNEEKDVMEGVVESGTYGGILGLIFGGATSPINVAGEYSHSKEVERQADIEALNYVMESEQRKARRARWLERRNEARIKNPTMDNGYTPTSEQAEQRAREKEENEQFEDELRLEQNRENSIYQEAMGEMTEEEIENEMIEELFRDDEGDFKYQKNEISPTNESEETSTLGDQSRTSRVNISPEKSSEITQSLNEIKNDLENLESDTFLEKIKKSISGNEKGTNYMKVKIDGKNYILRIADHSANGYQFDKSKQNKRNTSIVIKLATQSKFKKNKNVDLVEFVYDPANMTTEKMQGIIDGIQNWLQTGQYTDTNYDGKNESTRTRGQQQQGGEKHQLKYEEKDYEPGVARKDEKNISGKEGLNTINKLNKKTVREIAEKYGIKVEVIEGMIEIIKNKVKTGEAYGKYVDQLLTLSEQIKESTAPHELLHAIFDMIDPETKVYLISQVMKSEGWSASKAEEWLADSFSNFFRTGKIESAPKSTWGKIKIFFKRVRSFINGMNKWRNELEEIFTDILEANGIEELQSRIDENKSLNRSKEKMRERFEKYKERAEKRRNRRSNEEEKYQEAYHGSKAEFDRFDSSHMGEGVGNQAQGWGHYVTKNKGSAKIYAEGDKKRTYKGKTVTELKDMVEKGKGGMEQKAAIDVLSSMNRFDSIEEALQKISSIDDEKMSMYKKLDKNDFGKTKGHLYEVEIPDPIKKNTPTGRNYFENKKIYSGSQVDKFLNRAKDMLTQEQFNTLNEYVEEWSFNGGKIMGENLYSSLSRALGGDKQASKFLESLGYDGLTYKGGRDGEVYVIFNDDALEITNHEKYQEMDGLESRVSGDDLLNAQDLIEEIVSVGAEVDNNGYVTVYHQTTPESADKIIKTGKMSGKEKGIFFSTSKDAMQAEGRGTSKIEFRIPAEKLELDDVFSDNADLKIKSNPGEEIDISEYLVDDTRYQEVEYDYDEEGNITNLKFPEGESEFDPSIFGEPTREEQMAEDKENLKDNPYYDAWIKYNNQNYKDDQLTFDEFMEGVEKWSEKEQDIYEQKMKDLNEAQNDPKMLELQLKAVKLLEEEQNVGKKFGKNVSKEVRDRQQAEVEKKREDLTKEIYEWMYPGLSFEEATYDDMKSADEKEAEWELLGKENIEENLKYFKKDKNGNWEAKNIKIESPQEKRDKIVKAGRFDEVFEQLDRVIEWKTPEGQRGRLDSKKDLAKYKKTMEKINAGNTKTKVTLKDVTAEQRALEKTKAMEEEEKARKKKEREEAFAKKKQDEYKKIVIMKAFQKLVDMQRFEKYPFLSEKDIQERYGFTDEEWATITEQKEVKVPKKWGEKAISDLNKAVDSKVRDLIEGLSWQNNMKRKDAEKDLGEIGEIDLDVLLGRDEEKGQREVEEFERVANEEMEGAKEDMKKRLDEARENVMDVEIDKERENDKSEKERLNKIIKSTKTDKTVWGSVKEFASDIAQPVSTRIKNISSKVYRELMRYFQNKDAKTNERLKAVDPFLKALGKMRKENPVRFMDVWVALANRNLGYANGLLKEYGVTVPTELLDTIYDEAQDVGLNINYLGSYFPMSVKAPRSFLEELMKVDKGDIASEIEKRIAEEATRKGGPLEEAEVTAIINSVIAGEEKGPDINIGNKHLKERNTDIEWTPEMLEYCDDPISTLIGYIEGMTQSIEKAKFLGKSRSGNVHTLADYVYSAKNEIDPEQQDELMELLKSVFNDKSPNKFVQTWRDLGTLTTLGSPSSTLTQLSDLSFSVIENGWRETLKAVWDVWMKREAFDLKEMGVVNRGEEYTNINSQKNILQKAIHYVFNYGNFFSQFDTFGKSTFIQSTWRRRQKRARKGEKGDAQLRKDIMKWTDDEYMTDKVINDIRNGVFSQEMALVMYMKLGNIQPLTKAQMPKKYLDNPNGRLFYQFKTFGIKQLDYVLQETKNSVKGFKDMSTGEKMMKMAQVANMVFVMTLLGVGADELKDISMRRKSNSLILRWLFGENVGTEQVWDKMEDNVLKLFGLSRYTVMQMRTDPVDAIANLFTSLPATNLIMYPFRDINKAFKNDGSINWRNPSAYQLIPVIGKYWYWIYGGGQDKQQQALEKEKKSTSSGGSSRSTRNSRSSSRSSSRSRSRNRRN